MNTPHINFGALKQTHWTEIETENALLVADFVQNLMNTHQFDYVRNTFGNDQYKQHNRGIEDGLAKLVDFVSDFAKQFPEYSYDVKHIYVDGESVIFHSHATVKKAHRGNDQKGFNIIDTWRIKDSQIVEHWDAIQPLDWFSRFYVWMTGGKTRNTNGVF